MTLPIPPSQSRPGARRRPAVNYTDLGYSPEDLPVPPPVAAPVPVPPVPVAPVPVAPEPLAARVVPGPAVVFPAAASLADPALISSNPVAVTPAVSEEEQWWADEGTDLPDDTDLPEDDAAAASAVTAAVKKPRRRTAASRVSSDPTGAVQTGSTAAGGGQGSGIRLVRHLLGLNRPKGAPPASTAGAGESSDGSAPGWLSDLETGEVLAAADPTTAGGQGAAAAGGGPPRSPRRVSRPSQDLEVSRAPRELGATVRRGLIGLVLLLIAFAGVKQVIWNPIFGRTAGTAAAGPTGMDQVAADGAATKYALDYLSYSPAAAGVAAAAVTADVVGGGDAAPPRWAGSGYLHADTAVPGSWHVIDAAHAVVSVTVRVHLAMPPSTQPTTTTAPTTPAAAAAPSSPSGAAAPPTPTKPTPTSIPTATKPGTAAKRPRPGKTTAAPKPPAAAALVAPAAAYMSASPATISTPAPTPETTAEVGTAAVPSGSASDPGAVPAGWTDLGSRWLTLAVPVQSNAGGVKVSPSGAVLSGEAPNLVTSDPAWLADPATTTATASVLTSFFPAYAQSNAGYLAEPGVDLAGLAGTVTVASVTGWNVLVPPAPASGAASASSGVGAAVVTWQLAGTDLQIQQSYSIALTSSQSRWYIAALSPVLSTTAQ